VNFADMSVKNKTLFFIAMLLLLSSLALFWVIQLKLEKRLSEVSSEKQQALITAYEKFTTYYQSDCEQRLMHNIESSQLQEAFAKKERLKVYELVKKPWENMQKENPYLRSMTFYHEDSRVFLRMDAPDLYGDYTSVATQASIEQKQHTFLKKNGSFVYEVRIPVYSAKTYIGSVEFSIDIAFILESLYNFYSVEGVLIDDTLQKPELVYKHLFSGTLNMHDFESAQHGLFQTQKGEYYVSHIVDLGTQAEPLAHFILFSKVSETIQKFQTNKNQLLVILAVTVVLLLIIVHLGFNFLILGLEKEFEMVKQHKNMINENVKTASLDLSKKIKDVSQAFCMLSGYEHEELLSKSYTYILEKSFYKEHTKQIEEILQYQSSWRGEVRLVKKDGQAFWVNMTIQPKIDKRKHVGYDLIMHDITDQKVIETLMITDGLTKIYNRHYFNEIFPKMIRETQYGGGALSFLIIDVDHFKLYNDNYGHQAGDVALQKIAAAIEIALRRAGDYCFRLGGEEFAALYRSSNKEDAYLLAQRIRKNIMNLNIEHKYNPPQELITASLGLVSVTSDDELDEDALYKEADEYLYEAKKAGRNKVVSKHL